MSSSSESPATDEAASPSTQPPVGDAPAARWTWQFLVAVGILVAFAGLITAMMLLAQGDDVTWQRRVFVFGAAEAIVFTAIGWLFGREVHRSAAVSARKDADQAKREAAIAREQARMSDARQAEMDRHLAVEQAKGVAVRAAIRRIAPATGDSAVDLPAMVDEMYKDPWDELDSEESGAIEPSESTPRMNPFAE